MGRWGLRSRIRCVVVGCLVLAGVWLSGAGPARAASWSQLEVAPSPTPHRNGQSTASSGFHV